MAGPDPAQAPLRLVWGEDEFAVQRRARQVFEAWKAENPDGDQEIIEATAGNSDEAFRAIARLREALQTLPFFGGCKCVWFRNVTFFGEDRVSDTEAVSAAAAELARELAAFRWDGVRLLISAGKVDRRRSLYKTLEPAAAVEHFPGLSLDDKDWQEKAEGFAAAELRALGLQCAHDAMVLMVERVGPNARLLASEAQKLACYVGERRKVTRADVEAIVTRGRHARAFALADAVGERELAKALRLLEDELWSMRSDKQKSEIGLLYGLISKVRAMLLARGLADEGLLPATRDYRSFGSQLKSLPADRLPADRRYNPMEVNAYVLFRAATHASNFTVPELVGAMEELLRCNRRMVSSGLDSGMALQLSITRILSGGRERAA